MNSALSRADGPSAAIDAAPLQLMDGYDVLAGPRPRHSRAVLSRLGRGRGEVAPSGLSIKYVIDGLERYRHDGRSYTVRPGEFLIVRAGAAVDVELLQPSVGLCLYLENPRAAPPAGPVLRGSDAFSALGGLLRAAGEALARDDTRDLDAASAETRRLLVAAGPAVADLLREIETGAARLDATRPETLSRRLARLEEARAYLHASRRGPVALSEVARVAGMSPFHLARNFRAAFGAGPVTYHEGLRLGLARRLLETGLSPSEVSADLGYSELRAFSRAFKRRFGSPPSLACAQTDEGAAQDGLQEVL